MTGPAVAVIGGGIVGCSAAALLAADGARVTVYEREAIAAGASGRNSGVVQHPFDPALVPLYHASLALYRGLVDAVPAATPLLSSEPAGLLLVSHAPAVVHALAAHLEATGLDLAVEVLHDAALRSIEPGFASGVSAVRLAVGYPVVPAAPTYRWANRAEALGATFRLGRSARPVVRAGRVAGVDVAGRFEPADAVLVAAGPWTPDVIDPGGDWRPIRPNWGVVVETLLDDPPRHVIEEAAMDAALGTGDVVTAAGEAAVDPATTPETSLVTAGGVTAVGSTFLETEPDLAAWTERILTRAATFVPSVADAPIRETRACARPLAADGRPLIGAVPWAEGLFVCAGHGPWGITSGPASARLVADAILGLEPSIPSAFDPGRFGSP